jgi:hypothetical protein
MKDLYQMIGFSAEAAVEKEQSPYPDGYSNVLVTATLKGVSLSYVTLEIVKIYRLVFSIGLGITLLMHL